MTIDFHLSLIRMAAVLFIAHCALAVPTSSRNIGIASFEKMDRIYFYEAQLGRVCTAPGEKWACYKGSKLEKNGHIDHLFKVDMFARSCAAAGCSEEDIRAEFCCHSEECLYKCYRKETPSAEARRKHKLREAVIGRIRMWQKFYPNSEPPKGLVDELED